MLHCNVCLEFIYLLFYHYLSTNAKRISHLGPYVLFCLSKYLSFRFINIWYICFDSFAIAFHICVKKSAKTCFIKWSCVVRREFFSPLQNFFIASHESFKMNSLSKEPSKFYIYKSSEVFLLHWCQNLQNKLKMYFLSCLYNENNSLYTVKKSYWSFLYRFIRINLLSLRFCIINGKKRCEKIWQIFGSNVILCHIKSCSTCSMFPVLFQQIAMPSQTFHQCDISQPYRKPY